MLLQIPIAKLQRLAGRMGEHETGRAYDALRAGWAWSIESRRAAWHAGQVLSNARCWPQTHLSGFFALTVYQAALTLWGYGFVCLPAHTPAPSIDNTESNSGQVQTRVRLDQPETAEARAFVNLGYGSPGITSIPPPSPPYPNDLPTTATRTGEGFVSLQDLPGVMRVGAEILRENYKGGEGARAEGKCLPPLVESLLGLMERVGARRRPER